jgi:diadenosine tetraphosphate (Ap4A) HIT family hydrolase
MPSLGPLNDRATARDGFHERERLRLLRSLFDFTPEEWEATRELLLKAKAAQDERLAPDGYTLIWNCLSEVGEPMHHAHLHVIPRFDDEPLAHQGGRSAIKVPENRRPDPSRRGSGRARSFGPPISTRRR